ncbi:hypothetical protein [Gallibacterium genomosp. 3]|uniref:Competence protein C n=1 Tax=Gallibacterium genomosp. 3 TaxID=505345 RepID=A0A1A7QED4_9PAST|nr:hypothetical protein [Gallibacterium genomosp. 3]OBX11820.1 hypothetical protein QV07_01160 [Gallibacterium genomosp. 3]
MSKRATKYPQGIYWYLLYLPTYWLALLWLVALFVILAYPVWQNWYSDYRLSQLKATIAELAIAEQRQQNILQALQKKVNEQQDTQSNTQKIAILHQQLTQLSQDTEIHFDMQMSNKDLLKVDLHLYTSFQDFIANFDLLFQSIFAEWAISSIRLERDSDTTGYRRLHISIQLFSEMRRV